MDLEGAGQWQGMGGAAIGKVPGDEARGLAGDASSSAKGPGADDVEDDVTEEEVGLGWCLREGVGYSFAYKTSCEFIFLGQSC